jgi:hypothetical protein
MTTSQIVMTLLLSKILTQLTYPLTLAILLSLVAGLLFWRHHRSLGGLCLAAAIAILWIPATPLGADYRRASLERRYPPFPWPDGVYILPSGLL